MKRLRYENKLNSIFYPGAMATPRRRSLPTVALVAVRHPDADNRLGLAIKLLLAAGALPASAAPPAPCTPEEQLVAAVNDPQERDDC